MDEAPEGAPVDKVRGTALVTGATGYIGSRLVPALLADGWRVRVLTRSADRLARHAWGGEVEVAEGSADEPRTLAEAVAGVTVAYYLIHSMDGEGDFVERDRRLAEQFVAACDDAGVGQLVYLSGLYPEGEELSEHLGSRREVEQVLLAGATPTVVLRAAVIVGTGSASFEMLRHLTERLPAMVGPRWLDNRIQPISAHDVLHYLVRVASVPARLDRGFDVGGPDVLTYREMIQRFARVAGLPPRLVGTVPTVLTPRVASHWIGFVTPVPVGLAKPLVGSLVHEVVCSEHDIAEHVPDPEGGLQGFDEAVADALADPGLGSDAAWSGPTVHSDRHSTSIRAGQDAVWTALRQVLAHPAVVRTGLWREDQVDPPRRLVLRSSLTFTGRTEVTAELEADGPGRTRLTLATVHHPKGFLGRVGWVASLPLRVVAQLVTHRAVAEHSRTGAR
ncbi:NAD(P)H-binding protein [Auraticoccus monumenti]|uniref:NAD(P)H-binding protein n=1 Tax=Auraticoccus monumenti TaxID=675864 RepID=UPI001E519E85|nr:NAD(P)H-binding protein [Auraticoccus monumenti]